MQRELLYTKHTGKFMSPKHSLLVFQAETNRAELTPTRKSVPKL